MNVVQLQETYKRKAIVLGLQGAKGVMEGGQKYDTSKLHCIIGLGGDGCIGYTAAAYKFGKFENFEFYQNQGIQFPALCELEMKATSKGLHQNNEEVVGLTYIGPVQAQLISAANTDFLAGQAEKAA